MKLKKEMLKVLSIDVTKTTPITTTKTPTTTTTTTTTTVVVRRDPCGVNEESRYLEWTDKERAEFGNDTQFIDNADINQCIDACDHGQLACESAVLTRRGCELSSTVADAAVADQLVDATGSTYLQKLCMAGEYKSTVIHTIFCSKSYQRYSKNLANCSQLHSCRSCTRSSRCSNITTMSTGMFTCYN